MALKLNGTNSVAAPAYAGADADTGLQCGTDEVNLVTGGTARLKIDSSGRVGIGTTSPNSELEIKNASTSAGFTITTGNTTEDGYINFSDGSTAGQILYKHSDNYMRFYVNAAERMRIDSSGRLLVGTTTVPTGLVLGNSLTAASSTGAEVVAFRSDTSVAVGDKCGAFVIGNSDTDGAEDHFVGMWGKVASTNGSMNLHFAAGRASYEGDNPDVTIKSGGNVGIGTTSPAAKFEVSTGGGTEARITSTIDNNADLAFYTNSTKRGVVQGNSVGVTLGTTGSLPTIFISNNAERMRIDSSGNVGLGTTSPNHRLTLHNSGTGTFDALNITSGVTNSNGLQLGISSANNAFFWHTSAGAIQFATNGTERMRIRDNGFVRFSTNISDSEYYADSGTFHLVHNASDNAAALIVEHSGNSNPYGIAMDFSDASPDNNSEYFLRCFDSSTNRLYIYSDGDIDNHDNSYGSISDQKLKQDIVDAGSQWDDLKNLRVRKFKFKTDVAAYGDEAKTLIGLVAQEAETVSPGLVKDKADVDEDGNDLGTVTKSVRYSVLYMKAIKALQEAQTRIEALETQHADLLARVTALEAA